MPKLLIILSIVLLGFGCAQRTASKAENANAANATSYPPTGPIKRHLIPFAPVYPTVKLTEYTLITDNLERDLTEADAVLRAKIGLPYAMHTKKREDFERVLGRNLVFTGADEHFDREGYIANRVGDPSKVKQAEYRNVTVQFIGGDRSLVTYSNIVEDEPGGPGAWKADMTWADILGKEDGQWKYQIVHTIDFRDLTTPK